jgi:hypothetical protein
MFNFLKTKNDHLTIRLTPQRRLDQALIKEGIEDFASVTQLTIAGTLTRDDFKLIRRKMAKSLQKLDISNATLEEGKLKRGALARCTALTAVAIPNWISEIGDSAFSNCVNLKSINIPDSVTKIGELAFWCCYGLTSIHIPNSVTELEFRAFNSCTGLTSVVLPNSLVKIGGSAFGRCTGLTSVTIPHSVTTIGNGAFSGCTSLAAITIPKTVTDIGMFVFTDCDVAVTVHPDNPMYLSENGKLMSRFAKEMGYCK